MLLILRTFMYILFSALWLVFGIIEKGDASTENCSAKEKLKISEEKAFFDSQKPYVREITKSLQQKLDQSNAQVVLLANAAKDIQGNHYEVPSTFHDESTHKYMHTGLAYKDPQSQQWKVIHLLNHRRCGKLTNQSYVSKEKLDTFFSQSHHKMDLLYQIPSIELQKKLLDVITTSPESLHLKDYNAISNPEALRTQNSNHFILNLIATAQKKSEPCQQAISEARVKGEFQRIKKVMAPRLEAQLCYKAQNFTPSIAVGIIGQSMGLALLPQLRPEVSTKDHSYKNQQSSRYPFVSAASVFDYLSKTDSGAKLAPPQEICPASLTCNWTRSQIFEKYIENRSGSTGGSLPPSKSENQ